MPHLGLQNYLPKPLCVLVEGTAPCRNSCLELSRMSWLRKNDGFVAKIVSTCLTKIFMTIFAPDGRLSSSATLSLMVILYLVSDQIRSDLEGKFSISVNGVVNVPSSRGEKHWTEESMIVTKEGLSTASFATPADSK